MKWQLKITVVPIRRRIHTCDVHWTSSYVKADATDVKFTPEITLDVNA